MTVSEKDSATQSQETHGLFHWSAHTKSTAAMCICIASMSYLIISVFPYSGFMAIDLIEGLTEENAGAYAGLIASSFMAGRALSAYSWGKCADLYGRRFALLISLALSCVLSLFFGLSKSFSFALLTRFLLGLSNSIMGTVKTAVSELAEGDDKLEKRAMGIVVGMWGWGFLWAPAVGGFLSEPVRQYPNNALVQRHSAVLEEYPFLLPNLICVVLCAFSIVAVEAWVPETLPSHKLRSASKIPSDFAEWAKNLYRKAFERCCGASATEEEQIHLTAYRLGLYKTRVTEGEDEEEEEDDDDKEIRSWTEDNLKEIRLRRTESGNILSTQLRQISPRPSVIKVRSSMAKRLSLVSESSSSQERRRSSIPPATIGSLWNQVDTRVHLMLYWLFSFVQVSADEGFPLYCISREGGLSLKESSIGNVLSGSGLIFAVCQYFVYAYIVNRLGVYQSLLVGSLCLPMVVLIPFAVLWNDNKGEEGLSWVSYIYLCIVLAVSRIIASVYFSSIFIALNRTVPPSQRATMNGLQTLGGSISKALGPTFAGFLIAFCLSSGVMSPRLGGFVIWIIIGSLGALNTLTVAVLLREDEIDDAIENE